MQLTEKKKKNTKKAENKNPQTNDPEYCCSSSYHLLKHLSEKKIVIKIL